MNRRLTLRIWLAVCATILFSFAYMCSFPRARINVTSSGSLVALPRFLIPDRYAAVVGIISMVVSILITMFLYFTRDKTPKNK
jgi:hypothetical protein